jgi:integrase
VAKSKHLHLLDDHDVKRWYDNVARGSIITADERLRRLGRFCEGTGNTPKSLIEKKRASPEEFDDFIMDFVTVSLDKKKEKPAQVKNNLTTIKSWLAHFGLKVERQIKLPASDVVDEVVPTKEQLARILRHCDPRSRVITSLLAFCGVRPESLGNYLGNDGLRLKDIPEAGIERGEVMPSKVPMVVVVRKTLSKARHQYFTFLPEEGCQYLKEYLESRMKSGEKLTPESPVIGHIREGSRLSFLRTTKLSWEVKLAIKSAGFSWRPYVLRSYCDTAFDIAESKGLVSHPWRQFFMGHKGDIEARYSTNKRLPPSMIEEMRAAYGRCEPFLSTKEPASPKEELIKRTLREQFLVVAGFKKEEVEKMDLDEMTDEELQNAVRQRLVGAMTANASRQRVVPVQEVRSYIGQGYEYVASLPDGGAIVKVPF